LENDGKCRTYVKKGLVFVCTKLMVDIFELILGIQLQPVHCDGVVMKYPPPYHVFIAM
jgi:hypothetical protein